MTDTPPAPTTAAHVTGDPCPRIEVLCLGLPDTARSLTVWRSYEGVTDLVRGASNVSISGDASVSDFGAPFGVDVTYTCQIADDAGVPSQVSDPSTPARLDVPDIWLQDPLDPQTSIRVGLLTGAVKLTNQSLTSLTYGSTNYSVTPVLGSGSPVGQRDVLQDVSAVPVSILTESDDDAGRLLGLLRQAFPILLRAPATVRVLPRVVYAAVQALTRTPLSPTEPADVWAFTVDSVRGPSLTVLLPARTLDDLGAEADTLDGLGGLYATLLDAERGATSA